MTSGWNRLRLRHRYVRPVARAVACLALIAALATRPAAAPAAERLPIDVPPVASDPSVKYDYDLVFVRAPRGTDKHKVFWVPNHPILALLR